MLSSESLACGAIVTSQPMAEAGTVVRILTSYHKARDAGLAFEPLYMILWESTCP